MSRFVDRLILDEVRLSETEVIQVRHCLTAIEESELQGSLMKAEYDVVTGEAKLNLIDWQRQHLMIAKAFIVDWNLRDENSNVVPYSREALESLDGDTVREISKAIDVLQRERRVEVQKKALGRSGR